MLPNLRKLFVPDPGMEFFDIDLDSADLRIVAWESDCAKLKSMFRAGLKPYVEIAKVFYDDPSISKTHPSYPTFKAFCHATNYLGTPKGISPALGLSISELTRMQDWYFNQFPEIKRWQNLITSQVNGRGYVENVFGYRFYIFDRVSSRVVNQALAWIPQSTVACLINRGLKNIYDKEPDIEILLQVHDSLAGQYPISQRSILCPCILSYCSIPLLYSDPLIIPVDIKTSTKSWGDCRGEEFYATKLPELAFGLS